MSMMTIQEVRTLKDQIQGMIYGALNKAEETHQSLIRQPFVLFEKIDFISEPVKVIEHAQMTMTDSFYQVVRTCFHVSSSLISKVIDWFDNQMIFPETQ